MSALRAHLTEDPPFVAETLAWCNERRAEDGRTPLNRLPLGQIGNGYSCPCGVATGLFVGARGYYGPSLRDVESGKERHPYPVAVRDFVLAFDDGALPQYDVDLAPDVLPGAHPGEVV